MPDPQSCEILLIDDEASIRNVTRIALEDAGYTVKTAENGETGIRLCGEFRPQIVITDIRMPGMDGIAVLETVKRQYPDTEVIVVTAYGDMDIAIQALRLDASDFITKPLDDAALQVAVNRARQRYSDKKRIIEDQARILHQDKMISLGRLAASVVHEINNPMAGILNYIRLMARIVGRGEPDPDTMAQFSRYLAIIETETERCSRIISSLLTFSRRSPSGFAPVTIDTLIERCILLSRHKLELCNIMLHHRVDHGLPAISGDMNRLQQCLINLIFNAIDAMPGGGELRLAATHDPGERRVVISVTDTGTGIAEKDLPHIFEPFFTTKREGYGVGLGLSTVYGIMADHNGSVDVRTAPAKGSTFYLRFPVDSPNSSPATP